MTAELRRLLTPRDDGGGTYPDADGWAVIRADRVGEALRRVDDLVDRLVGDLARAWGVSESVVRARQGLGEPGSANEAHRAVSGRLSAHPDHRQATTRTRKVDP